MYTSRRSPRGATLVEVLVAVTLLASGLVALAAVSTATVRRLADARREERAIAGARDAAALAAARCTAFTERESTDAVVIESSAGGVADDLTVDRHTRFPVRGRPVDRAFSTVVRCP